MFHIYVKGSDIIYPLPSDGRHPRDNKVALHYKKMKKLCEKLFDIRDLGIYTFGKSTDAVCKLL